MKSLIMTAYNNEFLGELGVVEKSMMELKTILCGWNSCKLKING